jgi:hypothetical protein
MRLRGVTSPENRQYAEYLIRLFYTPKLYRLTSLLLYINVYDNYKDFYTTLFPSALIATARDTSKLFAERAILVSYNISAAELNGNIL